MRKIGVVSNGCCNDHLKPSTCFPAELSRRYPAKFSSGVVRFESRKLSRLMAPGTELGCVGGVQARSANEAVSVSILRVSNDAACAPPTHPSSPGVPG